VGDAVATASPARLLVMLYDRLVLDLLQAERAQREKNRETANTSLQHAQRIVVELQFSLDVTAWDGGPGLSRLYTYLLSELTAANVRCDADRTARCRALVEPLQEAWREAATQVAS
jgi:flagellar protein FliS